MMIGPIRHRINEAAAKPRDEDHLRACLGELICLIWVLISRDPVLPRRLMALLPEHGDRLKVLDAEAVVDALEKVAGDNPDDHLRDHLLALRLVIAQLGGVHSAMRIGRVVIEEIRTSK